MIATAWDTSYVLYDGIPDAAEIARLAANAPRQEAGRFGPKDLVLARANKSVRLFDHVVERLAEGQQPDAGLIESVGYLMRTTAVYGNGKFGIADRGSFHDRSEFNGPFRAEMLDGLADPGLYHPSRRGHRKAEITRKSSVSRTALRRPWVSAIQRALVWHPFWCAIPC